MTGILFILTSITTLLCAILLLRGYANVRKKLLLWSGLCFIALTIANLLVFADLVLFPALDLYTYRLGADLIAMSLLLYGLIWESQ